MKPRNILMTVVLLCLSTIVCAQEVQHPCLILTKKGMSEIKAQTGKAPLFDSTVKKIRKQVDIALTQPMDVPVPKDAGGGYTHEQHKRNYTHMYHAGVLYQLTGETKYAEYVKELLLKYAKLYPTLPLHPVQKSSYRGKLFWQGLNECVWLVNVSQAYDCIYDYLAASDRNTIESNLFKPMVHFIAIDNKSTFEKIHNHGTWAVAGVGMISYVMSDKEMLEKALYGLDKSGNAGFIRQIDRLFSPDGYFEEGPYYQRYSLQPFVTFAQAIDNNEPERKIFDYKDGVLLKAVTTLLQLTETSGQFFHLNDALDKTWHSTELVWGIDIAYARTGNRQLLSVAKEQNAVMLSEAGYKVAADISRAEPFVHHSQIIRDGAKGDKGGIGILRTGKKTDETCIVLKYTSQGMGHGHFDKLSFTYYDNGNEIIQDYGAARFLNIEPKNGGHYLKENDTFCKQTISHNTLVVDEKSHFNGILKEGSKYAPDFHAFAADEKVKMVSATDKHATPGVSMQRSMFLLNNPAFERPLVIDLLKVISAQNHQYDLPFYFKGQLIYTDYAYQAATTTRMLAGTANGYQHLWIEAKGKPDKTTASTTWLNGNRFYTVTTLTDRNSEIYLNRIGGTDPNFNLRNEPCLMLRQKEAGNHTFVSAIEVHGDYNPQMEYTLSPYSAIRSIAVPVDTDEHTVIEITTTGEQKVTVCMANRNQSKSAKHKAGHYHWTGVYDIK